MGIRVWGVLEAGGQDVAELRGTWACLWHSASNKNVKRVSPLESYSRHVSVDVPASYRYISDSMAGFPDHLFWHPRHQYERSRQVAVLLREIDKFRTEADDGAYADWPCFFAGGKLHDGQNLLSG